MVVKIFIERTNQNIEMEFKGKVKDLIKELGLNPEEILVAVNGEIVTEDEEIKGDEEIKIISVISGG